MRVNECVNLQPAVTFLPNVGLRYVAEEVGQLVFTIAALILCFKLLHACLPELLPKIEMRMVHRILLLSSRPEVAGA